MGKRLKFGENLEKFKNSIFKTEMISNNKVDLFHMNKVEYIILLYLIFLDLFIKKIFIFE